MLQVQGVWTFRCSMSYDRTKKLASVCEKELKMLDAVEGVEEKEYEESDSEDVEHLGATTLPSCVIHQVLTGTKKKIQGGDSDWRRTNIFHTRMEHGGCALNVIIDNRSGMNVIFSDAVERLGLTIEKHPSPYRVSWVNEDNPILVKHRCLVKFALGRKYTDETWCDVVPMTCATYYWVGLGFMTERCCMTSMPILTLLNLMARNSF